MWTDCRARFGGGGPFLFGAFSAADAMYAPVVCAHTYDVEVGAVARQHGRRHGASGVVGVEGGGARRAGVLAEDEVDWPTVLRVGSLSDATKVPRPMVVDRGGYRTALGGRGAWEAVRPAR